jgi:CHAD domain-containing protein
MNPKLELGKEHLHKSVQKIQSQMIHDLEDIILFSEVNRPEATHLIRKRLKRFRAFARLFREFDIQNLYPDINSQLRDWGRKFSRLRDADVTLRLIGQLDPRKISLTDERYTHLYTLAEKEAVELESRMIRQLDIFNSVRKEIVHSHALPFYFDAMKPEAEGIVAAVRKSYHVSQTAFEEACETLSDDDFHEWRKRLKDLQYQLELFSDSDMPLPPTALLALGDLNAKLGDDQDLGNLMRWALSTPQSSDLAGWLQSIEKSANRVKNESVTVGKDFYHFYNDYMNHG